ncbi:MAG: DUF481 domain-containing protein [Gemmatimonadaceae bacterium]|nr:DUF481 domain-containing protein [Gemmatimonadaceae bacterium]
MLRSRVIALLALTAGSLGAQAPAPAPKAYEGSASFGFSQTSGNASATALNIVNKLKYSVRGWAVGQDLAFFYGKAENKVNAEFWSGGLRGERQLTSRLGAFVATRYDRNLLQGISRRTEEGFGLDFKALIAPKDKLTFTLGASAFQQTLSPGSTSAFKRNYPAARLGADYKHAFTDVAYFQQLAEFLPNLSDTEVYLLNTESALVAPITKALGLKAGYVIRYNSQPPVRAGKQLKNTDTFFSTGLTYSF